MARWRGLEAVYTPEERELMTQLPVNEQFVLHILKAMTPGEIGAGSAAGLRREKQPGLLSAQTVSCPPQAFTDPEDLEFGPPKRRKKTYALVWSWRRYRVYKTKKQAEHKLKVWKKWYERQGWKVYRIGAGYWAEPPGFVATEERSADSGDQRHVCVLHEYDALTLERL